MSGYRLVERLRRERNKILAPLRQAWDAGRIAQWLHTPNMRLNLRTPVEAVAGGDSALVADAAAWDTDYSRPPF